MPAVECVINLLATDSFEAGTCEASVRGEGDAQARRFPRLSNHLHEWHRRRTGVRFPATVSLAAFMRTVRA